MLSITLLTSCASVRTAERVPEIVFPVFPALDECERTDRGVIVSEEWIVRLAEYRILIEETEKTYNDIRGLYGR